MNNPVGIAAKKPHSYKSIEDVAADVREVFGLSPVEPADMSEIFEFSIDDYLVGSSGKQVPMIHGVEELTTEALTQWNPEEGRIELLLSNDWYNALCDGHPRASFTVAHELGHAVLHTSTLIELGNLNLRSQAALHRGLKEHKTYLDTEWQANSFAAAFLMPIAGIRKLRRSIESITSISISNQFGVSLEAASIRLDVIRRGSLGSF